MRRNRLQTDAVDFTEMWSIGYDEDLYDWPRYTQEFNKLSFMEDGIHGKVNRPESPCFHRKVLAVRKNYPELFDPIPTGTVHTIRVYPPPGEVRFEESYFPGTPPNITGAKFLKFLQDSSKIFTEQFDDGASLANFIIELKDFSSAVDEAKKLFNFRNGGGMLRSIKEFLHGRAENGLGGNFLDIELNWKSLIRDIPDILGAYSKAMKRLEFLAGHSQFKTHRRIQYTVEPETEGFDTIELFKIGDLNPPFGLYYHMVARPSWMQVVYNASAFIDNRLQLQDINTWWAVADVLGLNNSPRIVWNAVKLSWVADMFVETEEFLDAFEVEAYSGSLAIKGGNASWKSTRMYDIVIRVGNAFFDYDEYVVGSVLVKEYDRVPLTLTRPGLLGLSESLNSHQQSLLLALTDARVGLTAGSYRQSAEYAQTFKKNVKSFGRHYWKKVRHKRV